MYNVFLSSKATKAYLAGNKALAKDLGAKGRWCCDKMKECHAVAAEGIFQDRNKRFRNTKLGVPQVLDLHGLHMSEASRILHRELECLSKLGKLQSVSVLVGTGHHTKVRIFRILDMWPDNIYRVQEPNMQQPRYFQLLL